MQRNQILVKLNGKTEGDAFIDLLEKNGFKNVHNVNYENLKLKVLIIDKTSNEFFSTNVTCLAALSSANIKPISTKEFVS